LEFASTIPSNPIFTSTGVTPAAAQASSSVSLIRREALAMSGVLSPTPSQKSLMPPPVPVASTTGARKSVFCAKRSATAVAKGKTVEEPAIRIWSRAAAAPLMPAIAITKAAALVRNLAVTKGSPCALLSYDSSMTAA
jgi:hypothetical protein